MAVYHRKPKILSVKDMFLFWVYNLKKEKPHLITKNFNSRACGGKSGGSKMPELWYVVKQELEYLRTKNLSLDVLVFELEKVDNVIDKFTPTTVQIFELKKEIQQNKQRIAELEKLPENKAEMIINYKQFRDILNTFNQKASDQIVQGHTLNLNNRLGFVQIRKIVPKEIGRKEGRIDWGESYKYKAELESQGVVTKDKEHPEGKNWLVYVKQSFYLRWAWMKRKSRACTVKNNRVYVFTPTASSSGSAATRIPGNKAKLVTAQQENPLLHLKYTVVNLAGKESTIVLNT
jgi:hypothetical protein